MIQHQYKGHDTGLVRLNDIFVGVEFLHVDRYRMLAPIKTWVVLVNMGKKHQIQRLFYSNRLMHSIKVESKNGSAAIIVLDQT